MARILIAASDVVTAQGIQGVLENRGHQTASVWEAMEVVDFCGKHTPDLVVIDMRLSEGRAWSAVQIMRRDAAMATVPVFGLAPQITELEIEHAKALGFVGLEPMPASAEDLAPSIDRALSLAAQQGQTPSLQSVPGAPAPAAANGSIAEELQSLIQEIRQLADGLSPHTATFGTDGPELFAFIDTSTNEILAKLNGYIQQGPDHASLVLQDREVRHDFRNMIGSVTGFSELILMETSIPEDQRQQFTQIRHNSSKFVSLLDQQKQVATAA